MSPIKLLTVLILLLSIVIAGCSKQDTSFKDDVFPIIKDNCLDCHKMDGEGYEKTKLGLQDYQGLMKGTLHGPVVVAGSSISSTLIQLLEHKADPSINMPHNQNKLSNRQIEKIKSWINQGAKNN